MEAAVDVVVELEPVAVVTTAGHGGERSVGDDDAVDNEPEATDDKSASMGVGARMSLGSAAKRAVCFLLESDMTSKETGRGRTRRTREVMKTMWNGLDNVDSRTLPFILGCNDAAQIPDMSSLYLKSA